MTTSSITRCRATADVVAPGYTVTLQCAVYNTGDVRHADTHVFDLDWAGGIIALEDVPRSPDHRSFVSTNASTLSPKFELQLVGVEPSPPAAADDSAQDALVTALEAEPPVDELLTVSVGDDEQADFATGDGRIAFVVGARWDATTSELVLDVSADELSGPFNLYVDGVEYVPASQLS